MLKSRNLFGSVNNSLITGSGAVRPVRLQALEQRLLLDAAAAGTMADALSDQAAAAQASAAIEMLKGEGVPAREVLEPGLEEFFALAAPVAEETTEVVFIDSSVEDAATLLAGVSPHADVYFLSAESDGVTQIADILEGYASVDAVHILSHGFEGRMHLGNESLTALSIQQEHADDLARIGAVLSDTADILIYGCDFGDDSDALQLLAQATGADVAASTNDTGAAALGGDWVLEATTGAIEASVVISEAAQANWDHLLTVTVSTGANGVTATDLVDAISPGGLSGITIINGTADPKRSYRDGLLWNIRHYRLKSWP